MKRWMTVATMAVAMTFAVAVAKPSTARADTEDILIYSSAAAAGAIVLVLVATYMTRDEGQIFLNDMQPELSEENDSRIHFGEQCKRPDGTLSLLCW